MVVRLRLARHGTRSNPFYHLVAIQNTKARDALPIEKLGEYDPVPKPEYDQPTPSRQQAGENRPGYNGEVIKSGIHVKPVLRKRLEWNEDRIRYWLGVGAQPSKPVFKLLYRTGLIPEDKVHLYMRTRTSSEPKSEATSNPPTSD
ncbi:MRPS16 [Malassezia furfur]|nr:MRPS16 [Malassezia furfur]